jgi:hypothetical protein
MVVTAAEGPSVLIIYDMPDPSAAVAITGIAVASGAAHNVKFTRVFTQEEITHVRHTAAKLRGSYKPPQAKN